MIQKLAFDISLLDTRIIISMLTKHEGPNHHQCHGNVRKSNHLLPNGFICVIQYVLFGHFCVPKLKNDSGSNGWFFCAKI